VKERGIIFSAPMITALRRETSPKTQTRRVAKFKTDPGLNLSFTGLSVQRFGETWSLFSRGAGSCWEDRSKPLRSPYGLEGDRLWVRETHQFDAPVDGTWPATQFYGCKGAPLDLIPERFRHPNYCLYRASWLHGPITWRPAIHMPRWASRILLEITDVRIERLNSISDADAIAEGIEPIDEGWRDYMDPSGLCIKPRTSYQTLWDSINGAASHKTNPWIWAVSFKEIQP